MTAMEGADDPRDRVVLARAPAFRLGRLAVEPQERTVSAPDGAAERPEPRVMQVLVALSRADGAVLTREEMASSCWGGVHVGDDALSRVIARLRRVAEGFGNADFAVETMPRVGLRRLPWIGGGRDATPAGSP